MKTVREVADEIMGWVATGRGIRGGIYSILLDWRDEIWRDEMRAELRATVELANYRDRINDLRCILRQVP